MTAARSIDVVTFNAVGAMPRDRKALGNRILRTASRHADLLIGVECDDVNPWEVLDSATWWIRHRGGSRTLDGCLIAGRRTRTATGGSTWLPGAPASRVNLTRPIMRTPVVVDHAWKFRAAAMHVPKPSGGERAAGKMFERSRGYGLDLIGTDANLRHDAVQREYPGRPVRSAEVMHIIGNPALHLGKAEPFDLIPGTSSDDHPGLMVRVRPA